MSAKELIDIYIQFFEKRGHKKITNSPLVPENDPTTLFTSSGMQPLVPYLLGEEHPQGTRLVNVQNSFRAQDIDEIGDNRHTTFFRMLGNWSLGDYFKKEEIPWLWEFLTKELGLPKEKLYITVFKGDLNVEKDNEAYEIWSEILANEGFRVEEKVFFAGVDKNWWSRSGVPDNMPVGEPGGPDSEVYFKFDDLEHDKACNDNPVDCECGKFLEIANAVFMQYIKKETGFEELPKRNVDFGGGLERLLAAVEQKSDVFKTSLFNPIISAIENETGKSYKENFKEIRIIADHLIAGSFIAANGVYPSNKEQGYVLRRLIRRAYDNFNLLGGENISFVLEKIVEEYSKTDELLKEKFEEIKNLILEEGEKYKQAKKTATDFIIKKYGKNDDSAEVVRTIDSKDAFNLYTSYGLSPTQIKSLGYSFNEQEFASLMEEHKKLSKTASAGMFKGGLADTSELTVMGHTATHLLHQALRDVLGDSVHQTGSNITSDRVRFDFNFERNLTPEELTKVEEIVNEKINDNLEVHYEMMPLQKAKEIGAIGLFDDKYQEDVKVYFVGDYSKEFCGGPHVEFTGVIKKFKIIKQENLGKGQKRIYSKLNSQI
jgi:alanyl-tRNA synthetase